MNAFVDYVHSFYGKGQLYDINATRYEILIATGVRLERHKEIKFIGDSIDREMVRDIILEMRGLKND